MKEHSIAVLKRLAKKKGYTLLSQQKYDKLRAQARPEYVPTPTERRAIERGEKAHREGRTVPLAQALRALER